MELRPLSENRLELYEPDARNQLIIAGAGSGKTYTLVNTVVNRIRTGHINPLSDGQKVIIFTFTKNAAEELVVRLSQELENDEKLLNEMFVGTIHGWANQYLDQNANLANTKILDELERSQLIQRIYNFLDLGEVYDTDYFHRQIELFENDLEIYYNENLSLADPRIPDEVRPVIRKYVNFIEEQRLIDFGSLIRRAIRELEGNSPDGRQYHLFIDEYQDVNPAQVDLFRSFDRAGDQTNIFAVGDPRQAIYQWRGGDINRILEFDQDFDDVEAYTLNTNRRSRSGIVDFSNGISEDMGFHSIEVGDMVPHSDRADSALSVIGDTHSTDHAAKVADEVIQLHNDEDVPFGDIAILLRSVTSGYGQDLMDELDRRGISYHSPNRNSGTQFVEDVMFSVIELISVIEDTEGRNFQTQQEQREVEERIQELCGVISQYSAGASSSDVHLAVANWYEKLTIGGPDYENEQYNFRQQFYDFCDELNIEIGPNEPDLQEGFASITQIMKSIEEVYRRRFQGRSNVRSSPLNIFTNNLRWHLENKLERWAETGMGIEREDRLTVSTVHAAKGLQWPVVLVPHLTKNRFPVRSRPHTTTFPAEISDRYSTDIEDEKRLWYVAATRARDRLYFYSGDNEETGPFAYRPVLNRTTGAVETDGHVPTGLSEIEPSEDEGRYIHTGVSSFLLLLECPYHFHMRHSVGINPPVGEQFGAGNVLHRTIERAIEDADDRDLDEITQEEVYLPLAEFGDEKRMQNAVRSKIRKLIETGGLEGVRFTETPFTIQIDNLVVSGIVDAIHERNGNRRVIDWKSSIHEEFGQRYQSQILLYTIALRRLGDTIDGGLISDLSKADPIEEGIDVDVSEESARILLDDSESRVATLENSGPYTTPGETVCAICDISEICPDAVTK